MKFQRSWVLMDIFTFTGFATEPSETVKDLKYIKDVKLLYSSDTDC